MTVHDNEHVICVSVPPVGTVSKDRGAVENYDEHERRVQRYTVQTFKLNSLLRSILTDFDGTTLLCRVCGDKASGFHYGVHSCEGCKGFFRRSIQQKIQYRPCTKNQQCSIQRVNRNRCQYCRLKKCISVGMSRDAVRFGRVPKREKARIIAAMHNINAQSVERKALADFEDELNVTTAVIQSYMDTCEYTQVKVCKMLDHARTMSVYTHFSQYFTCPLNPILSGSNSGTSKDFSERFSIAIRGVINFSRRLPGFSYLPKEDQMILLKESAFEALLVRLTALFDSRNNTLLCMNGRLMKREAVYENSNSRFLMDSMFSFSERLNSLGLCDEELALFSAVVVMTPERPGIRSKDLVGKMHQHYAMFLRNHLMRNHPDAPDLHEKLLSHILDLKTLNTLHSEKDTSQKRGAPSGQWGEDSQTCWNDKDCIGSPTSTCTVDEAEAMRSPVSCYESMCGESASSEESVCGSESSTYQELRSQHQRARDQSESTSSGEETTDVPLKCPFSKRKVDSSEDSGIECDKISLPSICSSPRSSIDEKSEEDREEDMPVLRRALEAPPIVNTDLYMEAAYKPHKKFRALRKEDEPHSSQPGYSTSGASILASTLSQSSHMSHQPSNSSSASTSLLASALSGQSCLIKSLSEQPKMSEDSLRKADMLHSLIMQNKAISHRNRNHDSPRSSPSPYYAGSLSERLQQPSTSSWSGSSGVSSNSPSTSYTRPHLLTTPSPPTPSRSYSVSTPVGLGAQPSSSTLRILPAGLHGICAQASRRSMSPVMKLHVDIADSQQPLNLSKKSPPRTPEFMMEA